MLDESQIVASFTEKFNNADQDKDGFITKEEFHSVLTASPVFNISENQFELIMLLLDLDNDGRISLKEFLDFVSGDLFNYEPENTEQQKRLFRLFDMQNTGFVSEKDLKKSLEAFGEKATDDEIKDAIKLADKNGDGKVNYEEFIKALKSQ